MIVRQLPLMLEMPAWFNINDLVIGQANGESFALLQNWPDWRVPVTVLTGEQGSGKSHMAACWARKNRAVSFRQDQLEKALAYLDTVGLDTGAVILVEDITPGGFDEIALFHLVNGIMQARLQSQRTGLLLTSRQRPANWGITLADLYSRLKAAQLVEIESPDDVLLRAVLIKLFSDRQLLVESELISYCVSRMERSFEMATCFVAEIDQLALEEKARITKPLALRVLNKIQTSHHGI